MLLRLIISIALFLGFFTCTLIGVAMNLRMFEKVHEKRRGVQPIPEAFLGFTQHWAVFRQYRELYPKGRLLSLTFGFWGLGWLFLLGLIFYNVRAAGH